MPCIHFASVSVTAKVAAIAAGASVANGGFGKPRRLHHFPDLRTPDRSVTDSATLPLPPGGSGHRRPDAQPQTGTEQRKTCRRDRFGGIMTKS